MESANKNHNDGTKIVIDKHRKISDAIEKYAFAAGMHLGTKTFLIVMTTGLVNTCMKGTVSRLSTIIMWIQFFFCSV